MAIRKLRTKRDDQQRSLDLALNMGGRVQNFERDDRETPKRAHNYRMLPKMWRERAEHDECLARQAEAQGFRATAPAGSGDRGRIRVLLDIAGGADRKSPEAHFRGNKQRT